MMSEKEVVMADFPVLFMCFEGLGRSSEKLQ
jgi:hypothetical protein